ncbi:hypothetical protein CL617_00305 [archaeon]|nr:hypothetical protein [archaeon]|tara:strand:+ start:93 stop:695 length:603 start_codon:yes stop_codon:yes gene_type:complete
MGIIQWFIRRSWGEEDFIKFLDEETQKENKTEEGLLIYINEFINFIDKFLQTNDVFKRKDERREEYRVIEGRYSDNPSSKEYSQMYNQYFATIPKYLKHIILELDRLRDELKEDESVGKKLQKLDSRYSYLRKLIEKKGHEERIISKYEGDLTLELEWFEAYKDDKRTDKLKIRLNRMSQNIEELKKAISLFRSHNSNKK